MTKGEKLLIAQYRAQGMGYTAIADVLGLPKNTVKSFCRRNGLGKDSAQTTMAENICRQCGEVIRQNEQHKKRRFCSSTCRLTWWHAHRALLHFFHSRDAHATRSIGRYLNRSDASYAVDFA